MNYTFTIYSIGFLVLVIAGVGLATTLSFDAANPLGIGYTVHASAQAYVEKVEWKINGDDQVDEVKITVYNPDTVEHEYEVCMLYSNGSGISDTAGTSPDCVVDTIGDDNDTVFSIIPSVLLTSVTSTNVVIVQNW